MWCVAHEPHHELQKQLQSHLFLDVIKNGWYDCTFHLHFHPNWYYSQVMVVYATSNHFVIEYAITSHFYYGTTKDNCINNHKNGWFAHML
jgi:hypothetical protein